MKTFKTHYTRDKEIMLRIRMSKALLAQLKLVSKMHNLTMSEFVRELISQQ